jgi:hypothetical protein
LLAAGNLLDDLCLLFRAKIAVPQSGNLYRRKMCDNDVGSSMQNIRRNAKKERAEAIPGAHAQHQGNIRTYSGAWYRAYKMIHLLMSRKQIRWNRNSTDVKSDIHNDVRSN